MTADQPALSGIRSLTDLRTVLMLALGFSSGLPFLLVFGTLSAWLREVGISRTEIGLLSYVGLAYTLKFLWAPVVDAVDVPILSRLLGRRRAWMVLAQLLVAAGLAGIASTDPAQNLMPVVAFALLVAFASATQDVAIDGWRIEAAPTSRQGVMAAAYQLGYRMALIASGAGALYIAAFDAWSTAYLTMAMLVGVGLVASVLAPRIDTPGEIAARHPREAGPRGLLAPVVEPLLDLIRRGGWALLPILMLIALYRVPDFVAGVMANPLYIDTGFSLTDIANVSKLYGVAVGIAGAFAGGFAVLRLGLRTTLFFGAIASAGSNLMFSWLAVSGADLNLLIAAISIDNFAGGFAGTALIAFMSALTGRGHSATQYALLSSLYALPGKLIGGLSGIMVDSMGYPAFFTLTAAIGLPAALLALVVVMPSSDQETETEPARA